LTGSEEPDSGPKARNEKGEPKEKEERIASTDLFVSLPQSVHAKIMHSSNVIKTGTRARFARASRGVGALCTVLPQVSREWRRIAAEAFRLRDFI
jgi:hypothetical protein